MHIEWSDCICPASLNLCMLPYAILFPYKRPFLDVRHNMSSFRSAMSLFFSVFFKYEINTRVLHSTHGYRESQNKQKSLLVWCMIYGNSCVYFSKS